MDKHSVRVFWPRHNPPDILETRFSYDFCRRVSHDFISEGLAVSWTDYDPETTLRQALREGDESLLLIVTEPELVVAPSAFRRMKQALEDGYGACGPVFNISSTPFQSARLQFNYISIGTFLEIAGLLAEKEAPSYTFHDALNPACVLYRRRFLEGLCQGPLMDSALKTMSPHLGGKGAVDKGALVHFFGNYFEGERDDLIALVPKEARRVLDVGCAKGCYGRRLKARRPDIEVVGVELNPVMAVAAQAHYDRVVTCPIEEASIADSFDLINCGDVLEHLQDPWRMLKSFHERLRPDGWLVLSVPNIGHWSIVRDLVKGRFSYIPVGLLCVSHIRWFTGESIRQTLEETGFGVEVFDRQKIPPTPEGEAFIDAMCASGFGDRESLETYEYVIRATRN